MSPQDNVTEQRSEFTSSAASPTAASTNAATSPSQQAASLSHIISREAATLNLTHPTASHQEKSNILSGMMGDIFKEAGIEGNFKLITRLRTDTESMGRQHREGDGGARRTEEGEQAASAWAQSDTWAGGEGKPLIRLRALLLWRR
ncbi:hypothetical protein L202_00883 [Cryptococcus amylolentus CBS 6039]|uniref:Uncharacterized protein n=2 Tax=Cryptococcus amylolentus TaxID=104669 RepID=A0A1E3I8Z1_9TREE|nr:hypothetical protein L202_00883 [Cryptococcus amylolentus CBS 6039]ODN85054.1 hypothetical protein L202_00883 [Cryptococcus amylolentus CBS 6039]ODO11268.1 hypothetical protein I350_00043 [Cryptococcus amylolentus CBS 6273]